MKRLYIVVAAAASHFGCNVAEQEDFHFPEAQQVKEARLALETAEPEIAGSPLPPILSEFSVSSAASRALTKGPVIRRRPVDVGIQGDALPRPVFAQVDHAAAEQGVRAAAERFFGSVGRGLSAIEASNAEGMTLLKLPDEVGIAYSVPGSGAITLKKAGMQFEQSSITSAEQAVNVALDAIAANGLLTLAAKEALEVVGVNAQYLGSADRTSPVATSEKVAYLVLFGRTYAGVPVIGPPTLVSLSSKGEISTFRKGWRDIVAESGTIQLASPEEVESRRDELVVQYLPVRSSVCGYTEDSDPAAVQEFPGVGCRYVHANEKASDPMSREVVDWASVARNPQARLFGSPVNREVL